MTDDSRKCERCWGDCAPGEGAAVETREGRHEFPWAPDYNGAMFLCPECLEREDRSPNSRAGCFVRPGGE